MVHKKIIDLIVTGDFTDPDNGKNIILPVKSIRLAKNLIADSCDLMEQIGSGPKIAVISDEHTYQAAAEKIIKVLSGKFKTTSIKLPPHPECDIKTAETLTKQCQAVDMIVGVGSGTINDLCKYVSHQTGKPYAIFATAPSMNGYCSATSSIKIGKYKTSIPTTLPSAIFFDLDVIAASPIRLIRSGFGDLICRSTAQADWLLSNLLFDTFYKETPFELIKNLETDLLDASTALAKKDTAALELLCEALVLSGIGMYISGGSYPASQGEHLVAHYMEMMHADAAKKTYHGEQVAVTSLTMSLLQEKTIKTPPSLEKLKIDEQSLIKHFGPEIGKECIEQCSEKWASEKLLKASERLSVHWSNIQESIFCNMLSHKKLKESLINVGAPLTNEDLGWPDKDYRQALQNSLFLRNRFTFLDLAYSSEKSSGL